MAFRIIQGTLPMIFLPASRSKGQRYARDGNLRDAGRAQRVKPPLHCNSSRGNATAIRCFGKMIESSNYRKGQKKLTKRYSIDCSSSPRYRFLILAKLKLCACHLQFEKTFDFLHRCACIACIAFLLRHWNVCELFSKSYKSCLLWNSIKLQVRHPSILVFMYAYMSCIGRVECFTVHAVLDPRLTK